jgi:Protein of unknown function (DUF3179)
MRTFSPIVLSLAAIVAVLPSAPAQAQGRNNPKMKSKLLDTFDMSGAIIEIDDLLAPGVPKDGIPALTNPPRTGALGADYPSMTGRVITVEINGEAVAYPIQILNWHEAVNDTVGGVPIVVTYCPLCDSAAVARRTITTKDGKEETIEFGISGFLYNSNMVMYDKTSNGIWSQIYMRAMTGPLAGTHLSLFPVRVESFAKFQASHSKGQVLTTDTGYDRPYDRNPYESYMKDPKRVFHEFGYGSELGPKVLGAGILAGDEAVFISVDAIAEKGGSMTVKTKMGKVKIERTEAGIAATTVPDGVNVMQAFYHSWSAFHPQTSIIATKAEKKAAAEAAEEKTKSSSSEHDEHE